jgi:predicted permease
MRWLRRLVHGLRALFQKRRLDAEMEEEMRAHIEMRTQANIEAGMSPEEARYAALRQFGWVESVKELCHEQRGVRGVEALLRDLRFGWRLLFRSPRFTAVAVLTLALGIGTNTAIFTLINALFLKSLPGVKDSQQLVLVTDRGKDCLSCALYERLRDATQSLSGLGAAAWAEKRGMTVTGSGVAEAEPVWAQAVSGNFFSVAGVPAALGRALTPDDDRPGAPQAVAVISHGFWQRHFGLDPAVIGKTFSLGDIPFTIVGVAPREFSGFVVESRPDLWWPIHMIPRVEGADWAENLTNVNAQWLQIVGRLKPGVPQEQVRAELDMLYKQMLSEQVAAYAASDKDRQRFLDHRIELWAGGTGLSDLRDQFQQPLFILMTIGGLVLLIACANLAGLLLARGAARQREFSVRAALGAGRLTLVRQLVTESLLLAGLGGVLGLIVAQWGVRLLVNYIPGYGETVLLRPTLDVRVLAFAFIVSSCTGVLFGLIPAWRGSRLDLATALKDRAGSLLGRESGQVWNKALVVSQIAVSCCLLIGAGLFVRTVQKLKALDVGFNRDNLLVFQLDTTKGYDDTRRANLYQELLHRVENLSGVRSVTFSSIQSLGGSESGWGPTKVAAEGLGLSAEEGMAVRGTAVGHSYFETLGIPLLMGRDFDSQDEPPRGAALTNQGTRPVIIDRTSAHKLFGDENPVGKLLRASGRGVSWPPLEVIGVVEDVIHKQLRSGPRISLYGLETYRRVSLTFFYVRTVGSPLASVGGIRQIVRELDPKLRVNGLQTVDNLINDQLHQERTLSQLAGFLSLSALALACLGLYGILSYAVVRRTREIGVRMALGAQARDVLSLVIREGMVLTLAGCALGVALAVALTHLVSNLLYGVTATDPLTFAGVSLALMAVALLACYLPAHRAARIDPLVALRTE